MIILDLCITGLFSTPASPKKTGNCWSGIFTGQTVLLTMISQHWNQIQGRT